MTELSDKKLSELLRRVRALRAKAEDPSVTEAEAAAFTAKVAQMMAEHGLEEAQLTVEEQSGVEHETTVMDWDSPARKLVAVEVCRLYMVRLILPSRRGQPWALIGRKHNILMARDMTDYLIGTVKRLSKRWKKENFGSGADMIDFRRGCFERLAERLRELHEAQARAARPAYAANGNPSNLPALYESENRLLKAYVDKNFNVRKASIRGLRVGAAGMDGRRAADGIGLSPQIKTGSGGAGAMLLGKG
jgi:hypothetical protein